MPDQVLLLRSGEADLLDLALKIGFGDLYDVSIAGSDTVERAVSPRQRRFLDILLQEGICHISHIVVHEGEPVLMEVPGVFRGISFTKKIKL
jgi:hypothetical protein